MRDTRQFPRIPVRHYFGDEAKETASCKTAGPEKPEASSLNTLGFFRAEDDADRGSFAVVERSMSDRLLARMFMNASTGTADTPMSVARRS